MSTIEIDDNERKVFKREEKPLFEQAATDLTQDLDHHFGLSLARAIPPEWLARIGTSIYAPLEASSFHRYGDLRVQVTLERAGLEVTPSLREDYDTLIGRDADTGWMNVNESNIGKAIQNAEQTQKELAAMIRRKFAKLKAYELRFFGGERKAHIQVNRNRDGQLMLYQYRGGRVFGFPSALFPISPPNRMVEYGPGITGFSRLEEDTHNVSQLVFIDPNPFVTDVLAEGAKLYERSLNEEIPGAARIITKTIGMKDGSEQLLASGYKETVDIVVASAIGMAGREEIQAGIQNGYKLLKEGGLLIVSGPTIVPDSTAIPINRTYGYANAVFQKPPVFHESHWQPAEDFTSHYYYYVSVFQK